MIGKTEVGLIGLELRDISFDDDTKKLGRSVNAWDFHSLFEALRIRLARRRPEVGAACPCYPIAYPTRYWLQIPLS